MIRSEHRVAAPAAVVHTVLTDVTSWQLWSPHVDRLDGLGQTLVRPRHPDGRHLV